jgi:hypothetical protein
VLARVRGSQLVVRAGGRRTVLRPLQLTGPADVVVSWSRSGGTLQGRGP